MNSKNHLISAILLLLIFLFVVGFFVCLIPFDIKTKLLAFIEICAFSFLSSSWFHDYFKTKQKEDVQRLFDFSLGEKGPIESINLIAKRINQDFPEWIEIKKNEDARIVKAGLDWGQDYKSFKKSRVKLKKDLDRAIKLAVKLGFYNLN